MLLNQALVTPVKIYIINISVVELNTHVSSHIHLMPCTSGVLAVCSVELFDHYTIVLPRSQISLVVSDSPGKMADFTAPDGGELQQQIKQAQLG